MKAVTPDRLVFVEASNRVVSGVWRRKEDVTMVYSLDIPSFL